MTPRQGTRQIGLVTSGEEVPLIVIGLAPGANGGRSEAAQTTVYQKHRSLLKRKLMYRG